MQNNAINKPYIVLQGYPNLWNEDRIQEFILIIEFLKSQGCDFILPSEM